MLILTGFWSVATRVLVAALMLGINVDGACNANNCYRALFPCGSPGALSTASAFCATVTAGGRTATNFPPRATSACGTAPDKYVSACACGPTCSAAAPSSTTCTPTTVTVTVTVTPTPTPTPTECVAHDAGVLPNGDFECGRATSGWRVQVPDTSARVSVRAPGATGRLALYATLGGPKATPELGVSARIVSDPVAVVPNVPYRLAFASYFDGPDAGFVGVMVNGAPVYTVDARDKGWAAFHDNALTWTPGVGVDTAVLSFEFLFADAVAVQGVDTISFSYLH